MHNSGGRIQILKWLQLNSSGGSNYATFYDKENPFQGKSRNYSAGFVLQPSEKFAQRINYYHETFNRADTGERVYRVNLINSRSSYQFNRQLFLRAILRYDSSRQRVLTDFLGAYELVPGTVFYVGYGSLIERRGWDSSQRQWIYNSGDFLTTRRGLFIKLSYLQRF
jgi:hypothetical protein